MTLQCPDCHMVFNSIGLLRKHRNHFCVGMTIEIPQRNSPELTGRPIVTSPAAAYSPPQSTSSSMSIHLPSSSDSYLSTSDNPNEEDEPYLSSHRDSHYIHLRQQLNQHGKQLAEYQNKNRSLNMQKDEIERRLRELAHRPAPVVDTFNGLDFQTLRDHEARNQKALQELRLHIQDLQSMRPPSTNTSFLAEILALRQLYLGQGGNHANILAQLLQLETEVRRMQERDHYSARDSSRKKGNMNDQMTFIESENERIQQELAAMQERNNRLLANRAMGYMDDAEAERLRERHEMYRSKLEDLEREIDFLKQQAKLANLKREVEQPPPQPLYATEVPALNQPYKAVEMDFFSYGPYDPNAGFMVFYDFVGGLDLNTHAVRLVVSLYNDEAQYGKPSVLPTVQVETSTNVYAQHPAIGTATVRAKQPVPRCPATPDLALVVELQVASAGGHLTTRGWCKMSLFDNLSQLITGRFRIPFRILPIKPSCSFLELNTLPQFGMAELFMRIVNYRDAETQSMVNTGPHQASRYQFPPQVNTQNYVPSPPPDSPPDSPEPVPTRSENSFSKQHEYDRESRAIGFQVERVKHAEPGDGKIRLTAYYKSNAKIVQSNSSPVTASTNIVKQNYRYQYHMFGRQEAMFNNVELQSDVILVVRFYLQREVPREFDDSIVAFRQDGGADDQDLVAWGYMPLMSPTIKGAKSSSLKDHRINIGTHTLRLYETPVPDVSTLPMEGHKRWIRYGNATARIHIFVNKPHAGSLTPSEESDIEEEDNYPQHAWIRHQRPETLNNPFTASDGFDLYIDGCLNLPDSVTFTRVAGRLLTRKYERIGKDLNTSVRLECDIYNPVYDYRVEVREPSLPATTTLLLKVYTVDRFTKQLTVAGYATLNVFVETGTDHQPPADTPGLQISLNEGGHQLRLYKAGPDGIEPLHGNCLKEKGIRHVPCASILVRLNKAVKGPQGKVLQAESVPQADWVRLGLYQKRPSYLDKVYQSITCKPTEGEKRLFGTMCKRTPISLKESLHFVTDEAEMRRLRSDKEIGDHVKNQLTKMMDIVPQEIDLNVVAHYKPKWGLKFVVDKAVNLSWSHFTHAHFCTNPPGAFYQGQPFGAYDKMFFTEALDPNSTNKAPVWKDQFKHFPYRAYHKYLTMIVHLQEVQVIVASDSYKYGLLDQAWTAVPLFTHGYANTQSYQLPLFHGCPNMESLKQLAQQSVRDWMRTSLSRGSLKLVEGASLFVRTSDGRREDELPMYIPKATNADINTDLIPDGQQYEIEQEGRTLTRLVPPGKEPREFFNGLATKFKSLVYKLYEEGHVSTR